MSCGSAWSFTTTTAGDLYTWGYGDGGWMCVQPSYDLPYIESDSPPVSSMNGEYYDKVHTRSFDSTLNVLRPALVSVPADRCVWLWLCGCVDNAPFFMFYVAVSHNCNHHYLLLLSIVVMLEC